VKWLELSSEKFEPIPDIQFSLKKPLFAASVVLSFSRLIGHTSGPLHAKAELRAQIPLKGPVYFNVEVVGRDDRTSIAFGKIWERDVSKNHGRYFESHVSNYTIKNSSKLGPSDEVSDSAEKSIEVVNESPARLLAHLQVFEAFRQSYVVGESLYGGYIALGSRLEALRFDRVSLDSEAATFEVRSMRVSKMLNEREWNELRWHERKPFEIVYDSTAKTLTAARFHVPILGKIELKV